MAKKGEIKKIENIDREVTKYDFIICPNCGAEEVGKFCPYCGQSNKDFNKPIKEIFGELLDSINLDIRLLNTLIPFFTKPGFLAQEYFKGKRKKYVPPIRMYMLVSILFFFLYQVTDRASIENLTQLNNDPISDSTTQEIVKVSSKSDTTVLTLGDLSSSDRQEMIQDVESDTMNVLLKEIIIGALKVTENPDAFKEQFLKNISYVVFVLMPFFALLLALILRKSKKLYVHHLIFSINLHSFVFGLWTLVIILDLILPKTTFNISLLLVFGIPLYFIFGIKKFYNRTHIRSFFKALGILLLYLFVIWIALIIVGSFTAKGFY